MFALLAAAVLSQATPTIALVDISAADAVYEDVSQPIVRELAGLLAKGPVNVTLVTQDSAWGCRFGPCLGALAQQHHAAIVITVDIAEAEHPVLTVAALALKGADGAPLSGRRWKTGGKKKPGKARDDFVRDVLAAAATIEPQARPLAPDSGR